MSIITFYTFTITALYNLLMNIIKILKVILLTIAVVIGLGIIGGMFLVYKGIRSGNLTSYITRTAVDTLAPNANLTSQQKEMLEEGDFEALAEDLQENITPTQVNCAVEVLGQERANELLITKDPTPQEILKLSKCL